MTATAINYAAAASAILAHLSSENVVRLEKNKVLKTFTDRMNVHVLSAYAETAIVIAGMINAGIWSARKQAGGAKSASVLLKTALVAEGEARELNPAKVKRLVEKSSAILTKKNLAIPGFAEAARGGSVEAVLEALAAVKIKNEKALIKHVDGEREADPVARILTMIEGLDEAQRARLNEALGEDGQDDDKPAPRGRGKSPEAHVVHKPA